MLFSIDTLEAKRVVIGALHLSSLDSMDRLGVNRLLLYQALM